MRVCGNFVPVYFSASESDRYGSINILNLPDSIINPACPSQYNTTSPSRGAVARSASRSRRDTEKFSFSSDTSPADITAIGENDRSRHEALSVACKEQNHRRDFVHASKPVHRR